MNKGPIPRGRILAAGCVVFLFTGVLYAWSILSAPFSEEFGWTSAQLGLNFTIAMSCFCLGGLGGSVVTRRFRARATLVLGAVLCGAGYALCTCVNSQRLWLLYLGYGVFIGLGVGASYNAVLGTVVGWFPEKKGAASGVLLMGFGLSTLLMGSLATLLMNSPLGWRGTYLLLGAATLLVLLAGSRWMEEAPQAPPSEAEMGKREYATGEMVRTPAFWLLFSIIVCSNLIGTGVIGHSRYVAQEAGVAAAALVVGLQSVCNGFGRVVIGGMFDRLGQLPAMLFDACCFFVSCLTLLFALRNHSPLMGTVGLLLIGFSYGGMPTLTSAVTAERFGAKHYASNFSVANLSMLPASFGASIVGAMQTRAGSYGNVFFLFLGVVLLVVFLDLALFKISSRS